MFMSDWTSILRIWVLVLTYSPQILNGILLSKDFEQGEITDSLHLQNLKCAKMTQATNLKGTFLLRLRQSHNGML